MNKIFLCLLCIAAFAYGQMTGTASGGVQKNASGDFEVTVEGYGRNSAEAMINAKRAAAHERFATQF